MYCVCYCVYPWQYKKTAKQFKPRKNQNKCFNFPESPKRMIQQATVEQSAGVYTSKLDSKVLTLKRKKKWQSLKLSSASFPSLSSFCWPWVSTAFFSLKSFNIPGRKAVFLFFQNRKSKAEATNKSVYCPIAKKEITPPSGNINKLIILKH